MSSFTSPLSLRPVDDRNWIVLEPFRYRVGSYNRPTKIVVVSVGEITDFISSPRITHFFFPPWGKYGKAAILHDHLYSSHDSTKEEADGILLNAMKVLEAEDWKRYIMYLAVHLFGRRSYNEGPINYKKSRIKFAEQIEKVIIDYDWKIKVEKFYNDFSGKIFNTDLSD